MDYIKINQELFPREKGEGWWIVHPNQSGVEFRAPVGSHTMCISEFLGFAEGILYPIVDNNTTSGWITVKNKQQTVEMPYYLFARHFDAESFVRNANMAMRAGNIFED